MSLETPHAPAPTPGTARVAGPEMAYVQGSFCIQAAHGGSKTTSLSRWLGLPEVVKTLTPAPLSGGPIGVLLTATFSPYGLTKAKQHLEHWHNLGLLATRLTPVVLVATSDLPGTPSKEDKDLYCLVASGFNKAFYVPFDKTLRDRPEVDANVHPRIVKKIFKYVERYSLASSR